MWSKSTHSMLSENQRVWDYAMQPRCLECSTLSFQHPRVAKTLPGGEAHMECEPGKRHNLTGTTKVIMELLLLCNGQRVRPKDAYGSF